jgi:hypothetical protein
MPVKGRHLKTILWCGWFELRFKTCPKMKKGILSSNQYDGPCMRFCFGFEDKMATVS